MAINGVDFNYFKKIMKQDVLHFRAGCEYDKDEWNDAYVNFIECTRRVKKEYLENLTPKQTIIDWGQEFYKFSTNANHFCWLKSRNGK